MKQGKAFLLLHLMLVVYSCSGIFSKLAGRYPFLSLRFCLCYGAIILLLGIYAIGWQQVIKRIPLSIAYANKGITIVWGLILSTLVFREKLTAGKLIGAAVVIVGVVLFSLSDGGGEKDG